MPQKSTCYNLALTNPKAPLLYFSYSSGHPPIHFLSIKNKFKKQKYSFLCLFFCIVSTLCKGEGNKTRSHSCLFKDATILLLTKRPTPRKIVKKKKMSREGKKKKNEQNLLLQKSFFLN